MSLQGGNLSWRGEGQKLGCCVPPEGVALSFALVMTAS